MRPRVRSALRSNTPSSLEADPFLTLLSREAQRLPSYCVSTASTFICAVGCPISVTGNALFHFLASLFSADVRSPGACPKDTPVDQIRQRKSPQLTSNARTRNRRTPLRPAAARNIGASAMVDLQNRKWEAVNQPDGDSASRARRGALGTQSRLKSQPAPGVDQRRTESDCRLLDAAVPGDTNRQDKTHNSSPCEVLDPWHPWHSQLVDVLAVVRQRGIEVRRCRLNLNDSERPLEIPAWMFIRMICRRMRRVEAPVVSWEHWSHLHAFLQEQKALRRGDRAVDDQHRPQSPTGDADAHTPSSNSSAAGSLPPPAATPGLADSVAGSATAIATTPQPTIVGDTPPSPRMPPTRGRCVMSENIQPHRLSHVTQSALPVWLVLPVV
jgi:hypothetical protein